jgi:hypothetical protein
LVTKDSTGVGCLLGISLGEDNGVPKARLLGLEDAIYDGRLPGFDGGKPVGDSDGDSKGDWLGLALGTSDRDSLGLEDGMSLSVFGVGSGTVPGVGLGMLP